jgi:hypothetical protein
MSMGVAEFTVVGTGDATLAELHRWLAAEQDLNGLVRLQLRPPADGELGAGPDAVTVLLGSGGVGVALAGSLRAWVSTRRSSVTVKVKVENRSIEVTAANVSDVTPVLEQVLKAIDDAEDS